jgi:hypothetical protein
MNLSIAVATLVYQAILMIRDRSRLIEKIGTSLNISIDKTT